MGKTIKRLAKNRKLKNNVQGQFVIIAVLLIAIMMIALSVVMFSTVTYYKPESWSEYVSLVDNLKVAAQNVLQIELANYTKNLSEKDIINRDSFNLTLNEFANDTRIAFPSYGLDMSFTKETTLVTVGNYTRPIYDFAKCYWNYPESLSGVYAKVWFNLSKIGIYGYNTSVLLYLYARVDTSYIQQSPSQISSLNLTVLRENGLPVVDLTEANFKVLRFDPTIKDWTTLNVSDIDQTTAGTYSLIFSTPVEKPYYKWLVITIRDNRGIYVNLLTYNYIEFKVERATFPGSRTTSADEIYTIESGIDGHWFWNGKELQVTSEGKDLVLPPFPPLPIKQVRVNVTETGVTGPFVTAPCQYEVWEKITWHNTQVDVPKGLAEPTASLNASHRIVFQVKFPTLDISQQAVRIYWLDDLDAEPYQGPSDLTYDPATFTASTNKYRVEFIGVGHTMSPAYPYDYYGAAALLMMNPSSGLCFGPWNLHAFGKYSSSLAAWRPYGQWQIKYWYGNSSDRAVVRLIAILNSTQVQNVYNPSNPRSDYYDTYAIAFITANVKYLQLSVRVYWKQSKTDYGIWFASVMGNGGPTNYAFLNYTTNSVATYTYNYNNPQHREYTYPGYWAAHWNNQFGRGLILNEAGVQSLRSINASRTRFSVTESAPLGARQGSMEYEAVNCGGTAYTTYAGLNYNYIFAMWMYSGGGYTEVNNYYYMFRESYAPKIILPGG